MTTQAAITLVAAVLAFCASVTNQHDPEDREQPTPAQPKDAGDDDSAEHQRSPYGEFVDRLSWVRTKWRHRKSTWFATPLGLLTLFAVLAAAVFGYGQLSIMQRQLDEAQRTNKLTHRPWLEPRIAIVRPLMFHDTYAEVILSITMRNGGTGPAISAGPRISLTITGESGRPLRKGEDVFCTPQAVKAGGSIGSDLILPNSELTFPNYGVQTSPPWPLSKDGTVFGVVSGCVGHLDETGEPHATFVRLTAMGDFKPTGTIDKQWILLPVIDPPY